MQIENIVALIIGTVLLYIIIDYHLKKEIKKRTYYLSTNYKGLEKVEGEICESFYAIYGRRIQKFTTTSLIFEPSRDANKIKLVEIKGYVPGDLLQEEISFNISEVSTSKEQMIKKLIDK